MLESLGTLQFGREDKGVEARFVDEGGLCLVTRTGALN
jgi:hypothetical protein